jgi:DNA-binding transcriptional LysR family regulator
MRLSQINLNSMVYLHALLTECHVSRAAARVGLTQPAMSLVLKELRKVFHDPLLVKVKRGLIPTEKALKIFPELEKGLRYLDQAVFPSNTFSPQTDHWHFKIYCTDYVGFVLLPELMQRLNRDYSNIKIETIPWSGQNDANFIENSDLIIGFYPYDPPKRFYQETLFEESYLCMFRDGHPRIKDSLSLDQFLGETHIIVREQDGAIGVVNNALNHLGMTERRVIGLEVSHFLLFPYIVAKTDMIITTTSRNAKIFQQSLPIRTLPVPLDIPTVPIKQLWHERTHNSPAHQWLRAQFRDISLKV